MSLTQYCVLGLWAAVRAECKVSARTFDKVADFLVSHSNLDGGWTYRVTGPTGAGANDSVDTMTVAAMGTLGIARLLLFSDAPGPSGRRYGVLKKAGANERPNPYAGYSPTISMEEIDASVDGGHQWMQPRGAQIKRSGHRQYYYYTLERTAALVGLPDGWYTSNGDTLLASQHADGSFDGVGGDYGASVGTSFAVLFFMRSTQQILDYGKGIQTGSRDLVEFLNPGSRTKKPIGPLDELLSAMEGQDFSDLDVNTEEVLEKIQFSSREELIGQAEKLRTLVKSPDPSNRQLAYWALSRTGDFDLIPLMLDGLNDPALSVNIEAVAGLRYISRQPRGLGISLTPLSQLPVEANETARRNAADLWRQKASQVWRRWYSQVRSYDDRDGLDEIGLPID